MRFPGVPIRRTIVVVAREDEGAGIAKRIHQTALGLINDIFLPSLQRHQPDALEDIEVYDGK